jgi:hypothetical protein
MRLQYGPKAIARYPSTNKAFGPYARNIQNKLTGNTALPNPPGFATFGAEVDALIAADDIPHKTPQQTADRDAKALTVHRHIGHIVDYVQGEADKLTSAADAVTLILSAGLDVRKPRSTKKPPLAAKYTGISGEVLLVALAIADGGAYYWEFSLDQHTWTAAPETRFPRTTLRGLTVGQTYWFRVRALTPKGKTDPVGPVDIVAH